jgi:hypothetical protein
VVDQFVLAGGETECPAEEVDALRGRAHLERHGDVPLARWAGGIQPRRARRHPEAARDVDAGRGRVGVDAFLDREQLRGDVVRPRRPPTRRR